MCIFVCVCLEVEVCKDIFVENWIKNNYLTNCLNTNVNIIVGTYISKDFNVLYSCVLHAECVNCFRKKAS